MRGTSERSVAITGIGVRAPGAIDAQIFWENISSGKTATRTITMFDATNFRSQVAGECDFDAVAEGFSASDIERLDRSTQFAISCAREAIANSGLSLRREDSARIGVSIGSAVAAATSLEIQYERVSEGGKLWQVRTDLTSPEMFHYLSPAALAAEVAWVVGAQGEVGLVSDGCTSGIDSISSAADAIRRGRADVMIAGAADTPITPIVAASFEAIKATTSLNESPSTASRPFDLTRAGFVLAEGAAVLVLEELEHALARGAHVYALVAGDSTHLNAYHMTGLQAKGLEMSWAIEEALTQARAEPRDIDYINAHGSATRQNDIHETGAVKRVFGAEAYKTPMSSIKSMIGHSLGAIGSIEIAACALAIDHNFIPPTANLHTPDPECDLDYVPNVGRSAEVNCVLSVGSGFGGFQSAMVLRRWEE
ncbi:beta-ketoacyl-[acyl-carrier-protein] synthase family protein [Actinomyces johnsonii]|jgi:granaticin polyketide putative beta-ketoacyl synthase 1|nr:beta-ketoacyl-[acyl-carrier-protein] synthase family protein [Actinomyces johnsonii]